MSAWYGVRLNVGGGGGVAEEANGNEYGAGDPAGKHEPGECYSGVGKV